jgi:hypothetical protein
MGRTRARATVALLMALSACGGSGGAGSGAHDSGAADTVSSGVAPSPTNGAKCGATPTTLITRSQLSGSLNEVSAAMDVAVNASDLYAAVSSTSSSIVLRVPLQGGAISMIASVEGFEQGLVLTDQYLLLAESNGGSGGIVRMGLDGSHSTLLFSGSIPSSTIFGPAGVLASDGQNAYFATGSGIESVPLTGGSAKMLTAHTGAMALIGANVVVADDSAEGLFSVPVAGGPVSTLAAGLTGNLGPVVGCGSSICFASEVPVAPSLEGTEGLQQLGPSGSVTTLSQSGALYAIYRLVFDGAEFFATTLADASIGSLARIPAAGGTPVGGGFGSGLAVDDQCLYVADFATGVYSVAKAEWNVGPMP